MLPFCHPEQFEKLREDLFHSCKARENSSLFTFNSSLLYGWDASMDYQGSVCQHDN